MAKSGICIEHQAEDTMEKIIAQEKRIDDFSDAVDEGFFDELFSPNTRAIIQAARAKRSASANVKD